MAGLGRGGGWGWGGGGLSEMMVFIDAAPPRAEFGDRDLGRQRRYDTGDMGPGRLLRSPTAPGLVNGDITPV